ncbi:hypothetical protein Rhopal_000798-T1 [Rhodotorula paludigena]|uniref:Succinate dehydrogenase assembly factor 4, mitochondrial n=1 Tax=Rhodotorula paludigena TaxID=86838 RepID=A0AAV5GC25_9BASI|nr:hypothetical protein Rhopal_000798-T1 [Rhodotorula paludigena]
MLQALRTPTKRTLARCTCLSLPSASSSPARHLSNSAPSRSLFPPKDPSSTAAAASSFSRPAPPALPPHLQREFEALVKRAQTPAAPGVDLAELEEGQEMHPDVVKRPKPEFEGDENPNTGERGGPKREPLVHGDWAYGGKVTDF